MRSSTRSLSLFPAVLAASLSCVIAVPAFASGDDKPAATPTAAASSSGATSSTAARPDREKKVYTNDDLERMWPQEPAPSTNAQSAPASAAAPARVQRLAAVSRSTSAANATVTAEQNPLWYAAQLESLYTELDSLSTREASLREFRADGSAPGVTIGLQFGAPCEGITTDNAIQQLAQRRQEIYQQINDLQNIAQQNDISPAVFQDPSEVLQAAQKPLSSGQERAVLLERQSDLVGKLDGVQNELADMSSQAAAQGITLLPVTPKWGGNLTTNQIQSLDERAQQLQTALSENEAAARQAGIAPNALP
jgi:hypothetical protein